MRITRLDKKKAFYAWANARVRRVKRLSVESVFGKDAGTNKQSKASDAQASTTFSLRSDVNEKKDILRVARFAESSAIQRLTLERLMRRTLEH